MSINITFKVSGGSSFEQGFDPETTIGDMKKGCVEKSGVPAEQQRLIYKGRILKDADTIGQHKIESGHTIHLVKGAAPAGAGGGMGAGMNAMMQDPQVVSQMMQSPMVQQAMQAIAENPQLLQQMMATNPMMQQMMVG
ncbi:hypothetical protein FOZ63_012776 [Perkinsus olseni]|uniref:Ubiquitin-like domain-containing protein n=1 Tax=Perkinsus olseni TaxID=32597 RepID=A0A7J6UKL3_PEROL|nr:hypothetical protein FOZ63_012776 [Perkinsus olseni]